MLFTDRDFLNIEDVAAVDPDVLDVANSESIPTEGPTSFIHHAVEECANQLLADFQNFQYNWNTQGVLGNAGFFPSLGYDSAPPARIRLGQVIVDSDTTTYWSPVKRYTVYLALRNFYQICSNRKLDDKYQTKMEQIQKDIDRKYLRQLRGSGLPFVYAPVACPGAVYELNQGIWNSSNLSAVAGGAESADTFDVAITWVNGNAESAPSETLSVNVGDSELLSIDITSLNPPTGVLAWKVFTGDNGGSLYFQAQVPVGVKSYTLPGAPVFSGVMVGRGQARDTDLTFLTGFYRA